MEWQAFHEIDDLSAESDINIEKMKYDWSKKMKWKEKKKSILSIGKMTHEEWCKKLFEKLWLAKKLFWDFFENWI